MPTPRRHDESASVTGPSRCSAGEAQPNTVVEVAPVSELCDRNGY
jgi:hypothetical protein